MYYMLLVVILLAGCATLDNNRNLELECKDCTLKYSIQRDDDTLILKGIGQ